MSKNHTSAAASYFRNFIFGVEDSLVSTVGLLSGVAAAQATAKTIFLTGVVLIFVEAFSMAAGSFLSEHSAKSYLHQTETRSGYSLIAGVIMFLSYFVSGFVPLLPYIILPVDQAFWWSIAASIVALFALGVVGAKISHTSPIKGGVRMAVVGSTAIALGVIVGSLLNLYGLGR